MSRAEGERANDDGKFDFTGKGESVLGLASDCTGSDWHLSFTRRIMYFVLHYQHKSTFHRLFGL